MICEDVELSFETSQSREREAHGEVKLIFAVISWGQELCHIQLAVLAFV
jgi:hypothetical protein